MTRTLLIAGMLAVMLMAAACTVGVGDDDDDASSTPTATPTVLVSPTATGTAAATTAVATSSPSPTMSPTPTAADETATATPAATASPSATATATPSPAATATPTASPAPTPPADLARFTRVAICYPSESAALCPALSVELPPNQWAFVTLGWGTKTQVQLDQFLETVTVEVQRNGVPVEYELTTDVCATQWSALFGRCGNPGDGVAATFFVLVPPIPGPSQSWKATLTFSEDHDDGFGVAIVPAGTVTTLSRGIEWAAE